jgi:hypothetical protein
MKDKPKVNSEAQKELDKAQEQFDQFDQSVKKLTQDQMNMAPKEDVEPQTKISQKDLEKTNDIYLKPERSIGSKEKFNEKYREDYNYKKEYVYFTAENREVIGEAIEMWTKPFAGLPCEFWKVPVNKPVWAPRYVAEQIRRCSYHRMHMEESKMTGGDTNVTYFGQMVATKTVQRLDASPATKQKSVFVGASSF